MSPDAAAEVERLAAVLLAHQQRRAGGTLPALQKLDGATLHALRNMVIALVDAMTVDGLAMLKQERPRP